MDVGVGLGIRWMLEFGGIEVRDDWGVEIWNCRWMECVWCEMLWMVVWVNESLVDVKVSISDVRRERLIELKVNGGRCVRWEVIYDVR